MANVMTLLRRFLVSGSQAKERFVDLIQMSEKRGQFLSDRALTKIKLKVAALGVVTGITIVLGLAAVIPDSTLLQVSARPDHASIGKYICKNHNGWRSFSWSLRDRTRVTFTCKDNTEITTTVVLM